MPKQPDSNRQLPTRAQSLVVSGFLGSGKTTIVRSLLAQSQQQGLRVAVVSNEFGELGIDQALLGDGAEAFVELEGGCVCCKLSDDLLETLQSLWEAKHPDRVIVETSGVAQPYDTLINFWRKPVSDWSSDEVAVVVASAEQIASGRDLDGTFEDQVCSADLLILSKTDLVDDDAIQRAEALLAELQPDTPILRSSFADIDADLLFPPDPDGLRQRRREQPTSAHVHHHDEFSTEEVQVPPGLTDSEIETRLSDLGAVRIKGFVAGTQGPRIVQGVGSRLEITAATDPVRAEMLGRVVVIRRAKPTPAGNSQ